MGNNATTESARMYELMCAGRFAEAVTAGEAEVAHDRLYGLPASDRAVSLMNLATCHRRTGDVPRARECAEEAVGIWEAAEPRGTAAYADLVHSFGLCLLEGKEHAEAARQLAKAVDTQRRLGPVGLPRLATYLFNLAGALEGCGDVEEAIPLLEEAYVLQDRFEPPPRGPLEEFQRMIERGRLDQLLAKRGSG
jgi:tetratricopeptide (TPR) repeat protein